MEKTAEEYLSLIALRSKAALWLIICNIIFSIGIFLFALSGSYYNVYFKRPFWDIKNAIVHLEVSEHPQEYQGASLMPSFFKETIYDTIPCPEPKKGKPFPVYKTLIKDTTKIDSAVIYRDYMGLYIHGRVMVKYPYLFKDSVEVAIKEIISDSADGFHVLLGLTTKSPYVIWKNNGNTVQVHITKYD